jgi:hypothetical protein
VEGKDSARVKYDGRSLFFPTWTETEPLEQAERQARWLQQWLTKAVGEPVTVIGALALPGWFVEQTGRGAVRVFNGRNPQHLIKTRDVEPLSEQTVQRVAHQIEQRCRDVKALYLASEPAVKA